MHDQLSSVSIRQVIVPSTGPKLSQIHKTGEKCKLTDLFDSFPLFKPAIFLCFFEGLRMKCNLCATFKDKTGYLRNIIFLKKKKVKPYVLFCLFIHHVFPLKNVHFQRGPCVSHLRWKRGLGWLFCLCARRCFSGPYPSTCSFF